jgi:hypothetical protein
VPDEIFSTDGRDVSGKIPSTFESRFNMVALVISAFPLHNERGLS